MDEPNWLKDIRGQLPHMLKAVQECQEPFRHAYFEALVGKALSTAIAPVSEATPKGAPPSIAGHGRFGNFLARAALEIGDVARVIDLTSGEIIAGQLGSNKSDVQRKLAALISLHELQGGGRLVVPKERLKTECERFGAYDVNNFSAIMKKTLHKGSKVFLERENAWEVSAPGEEYVSETLRSMIHEQKAEKK